MIPVQLAPEPESFDRLVRQRGAAAIQRLLGQAVPGPGRRPNAVFQCEADIPSDSFPRLWVETRKSDGNSTLDDLMTAYDQLCAYLAMRIERATGSPSVDHFIPKERDWTKVYEWSNYRLSASCVNGAKGTMDVIDPFQVKAGWFVLNIDSAFIEAGPEAPSDEPERIKNTLDILNLRQCVAQRRAFLELYLNQEMDLRELRRYAPFIALELRRQGRTHSVEA